jgi:hypothetical protein
MNLALPEVAVKDKRSTNKNHKTAGHPFNLKAALKFHSLKLPLGHGQIFGIRPLNFPLPGNI